MLCDSLIKRHSIFVEFSSTLIPLFYEIIQIWSLFPFFCSFPTISINQKRFVVIQTMRFIWHPLQIIYISLPRKSYISISVFGLYSMWRVIVYQSMITHYRPPFTRTYQMWWSGWRTEPSFDCIYSNYLLNFESNAQLNDGDPIIFLFILRLLDLNFFFVVVDELHIFQAYDWNGI